MKIDLFGYRLSVQHDTTTWHESDKPYLHELIFSIERRSGPQYEHEIWNKRERKMVAKAEQYDRQRPKYKLPPYKK